MAEGCVGQFQGAGRMDMFAVERHFLLLQECKLTHAYMLSVTAHEYKELGVSDDLGFL